MTEVFVDQRWNGQHGIGRYATEVIQRLDLPYTPWTSAVPVASPRDGVNVDRWKLGREVLLYSPGFSTGPARCTQIITIHDLIHLGEPGLGGTLKRAYYDQFVRPVVRRAGHVFTDTRASAARLSEWLGDDTQIHVTGCGVSDAFTAEGPMADVGRPYFLYVGALKAHKRPMIALEAMRSFPDHRLVMVADPVEGARLASVAGVSDRVEFRARLSDAELAALYRGAEALLFPSAEEGFGLPPVEAIRCGCPVLFNDACAAVKEVAGDVPGLPGDAGPAEWAAAMADVPALTEPQRVRAASYDWDAVATVVDEVLRGVCSAMSERSGKRSR